MTSRSRFPGLEKARDMELRETGRGPDIGFGEDPGAGRRDGSPTGRIFINLGAPQGQRGLRVLYGGRGIDGEHVPVGDLGRFDWVGRLTGNRRNRLVAAGCGLQALYLAFGGSG